MFDGNTSCLNQAGCDSVFAGSVMKKQLYKKIQIHIPYPVFHKQATLFHSILYLMESLVLEGVANLKSIISPWITGSLFLIRL